VLAGESVSAVARSLDVGTATIRLWRAQAGGDPQKSPDYTKMVLAHLERAFVALDHILDQAAEPGWLAKQSADHLATFYGVVFDKQARVLAALRTPDDEVRQLPPPAPAADGGGGADPAGGER